jgi:hypothetical protein
MDDHDTPIESCGPHREHAFSPIARHVWDHVGPQAARLYHELCGSSGKCWEAGDKPAAKLFSTSLREACYDHRV